MVNTRVNSQVPSERNPEDYAFENGTNQDGLLALEPQADQNSQNSTLRPLLDLGIIRPIDFAFARFIFSQEQNLPEEQGVVVAHLAAYLSIRAAEQHTCIDIDAIEQPWPEHFRFPSASTLKAILASSSSLYQVHLSLSPARQLQDAARPLVLDQNKLYLQRYWRYECQLAEHIKHRASLGSDVDMALSQTVLSALFPTAKEVTEPDWQKIAVAVALLNRFCVITGGPGTGKTTTVTKLLALLQSSRQTDQKPLDIKLVAPTGKAAARLTESIGAAKQGLPSTYTQDLPEQCQTIHRLLGAQPMSPYFSADRDNPLSLDVLVLDEASMVDLPLMCKLFDALPEHARVIMLGDQQQLASVETGSVLADICHIDGSQQWYSFSQKQRQKLGNLLPELSQIFVRGVDEKVNVDEASGVDEIVNVGLADNLVILQKSHRFTADSGIGQLAHAIQGNDMPRIQRLMADKNLLDVNWQVLKPELSFATTIHVSDFLIKQLVSKLLPVYRLYIQAVKAGDVKLAFHCLSQQQVLCAQKNGMLGVTHINQLVEAELAKQGLINLSTDYYVGRPVMLTKNDHQLNVFNGDVGITMLDPEQTSLLKIWFIDASGAIRGILPSRLPAFDTLYAMTIHKSQGSEFEQVYLCMPLMSGTSQGRGLNRELLYTGLTRAKKHFVLFAQPKALHLALQRQCLRTSGLANRL